MRAPRTGRWGLEPIRGAGAGAGKRAGEKGWGGGPRRKEGRQASADLQSPFPSSHPSPRSTPLGICTCKEVQVPSLTLAPESRGSVLRPPKVARPAPTESPHSSSSPQSSPRAVASFAGRCPPRAGELLHCVSEKALGGGGMLTRPLSQPRPSSAFSLLMALSLQMCFRGALLPQSLPQPPVPRRPSQPQSSAGTPTPGGAAHTESASGCRVRAGACGAGLGHSAPRACGRRDSPEADTFTEPPPRFPPTHEPTATPTLGFQSIVRVLLFGSLFGYFPLSGGRGGRAPHAGLGTCPFPKAHEPPRPSCSICVQRAKCSPSRGR